MSSGTLDRAAGPSTQVVDGSVRPAGTAAERQGTPAEGRSTRVYYFDYLRVLATLGVVLIHSATQVFNATRAQGTGALGHYTVANSLEALGRFAVGGFFMVSGALLLDTSRRFHLGKQLLRVTIPLMVWTGIYLLADAWWAHRGLPTTGSADNTSSLTQVLKTYLAGDASNHFWFVYALIACYLALPLLRPITALPDARRKRLLEYALAIWAVTFLVVPAINHYAPGAIVPYPDLVPSLPSQYLGFVILGYYLHRYGVQIRGWRPSNAVLGSVAGLSLLAIIATTLGDQITGSQSGWGQTNPTPQVALFAASVFLLAKSTLNRPGRHFGFVSLFSRLSFRIYLLHMLILFWLRSISPLKDLYKFQPELSILVLGSITLVASFAIAYGIERITSIRRYV